MIVIAIVGILAAIALPAYQDYTVRARMSEPMAKLAEARSTIAEYYVTMGDFPATLEAAGLSYLEADVKTEILKELTYDGTPGRIMAVVYASVLPGETNNLSFGLSGTTRSDGSITWKCMPMGTNDMEPK